MMGDDDPRDNGRRVFDSLKRDVDQLEQTVQRLAGRLESVSRIAERVDTNRAEINRLRASIDAAGGALDRLAKLENGESLNLMPWKLLIAIIGAIAAVVSAAMTALAMVVVG